MTSHRLLPGQRAHPQIAWAKLREGAAIASKKVFAYEKEANEGFQDGARQLAAFSRR